MINDGGSAKLISFVSQDKPQFGTKFVHLVISLENFIYNNKNYTNLIYSESKSNNPFGRCFVTDDELDSMIYSLEFNLDKLIMISSDGTFVGRIRDVMKKDSEDKQRLIGALRKLIIDFRIDSNNLSQVNI